MCCTAHEDVVGQWKGVIATRTAQRSEAYGIPPAGT